MTSMIPLHASTLLLLIIASMPTLCEAQTNSQAQHEVRTAVRQLHQWLDMSPHGESWRTFLYSDQLEQELSKGDRADPVMVSHILRQYARGGTTSDSSRVVRVRYALKSWLDQLTPPSADQLVATVEAESKVFVPLTHAEVKDARRALDTSTARLEKRFLEGGNTVDGWKAYLNWDSLQEELARKEGPDLEVLDKAYARLAAGHHGLKLVWFDDVRIDLQTYLSTARAIEDPKLEKKYQTLLKAFPEHLEAYRTEPTPDRAYVIRSVIEWLEQAHQGRYLLSGIRHHFCKPNLFLQISQPLLEAGMAQPVRETRPVCDVILGTDVRGTANTIGQVGVELIPSSSRAHLNAVLRGTVHSNTIGYNGPARIFTTSTTAISSWKPVYLDVSGVETGPAWSNARTHSTINNICAVKAPRLVTRIAWKRSETQKGQADQIASQKAKVQIQQSTDRRGNDSVAKLSVAYQKKFREPLEERKLFPARLNFSTTSKAIHVSALQAGPFDLAAPSNPPPADAYADLSFRLHESMVNNMATQVFSGAIITEEQFLSDITKWLGKLPEAMVSEEDAESWGLTFSRRQPISVAFDDGLMTLTFRGRKFAKGENKYPGMNITVAYKIESTSKGFQAVREGDLKIYPPGFKPGKDRLSVREQVLQDMLKRRFVNLFESEIEVPDLELPGRWSQVGKLRLVRWEAKDGWMVMSWCRMNRIGPMMARTSQ